MNNVTRILIVESQLTDYELAQNEMHRVVKKCMFERVKQQKEFLRALDDFRPDLIVSDCSLPRLDGIKVVKLAQKHSPSIPIVIWSGVM